MPEPLDPPLRDIVTTLPREGLSAMVGIHVNPDLTIVARPGSGYADFRYFMREWETGPLPRMADALSYVEHLRSVVRKAGPPLRDDEQIVFQFEDTPVDVPSVSWEAQRGWANVRLIPDLYYFLAGGYEDFDPLLDPWYDRRPSIVWRGSSTGLLGQTLDRLDELPRYRMCKLAAQLGARADVALIGLVQAASPREGELIEERVTREGLLRPFIPMTDMARHQYILDIDGNSNSWNFMQKLRLGCCVLRVESRWRQWFADRLVAWEHYVPVAEDLSDLLERAEWCFAHPAESAAIAKRGRKFALDMKFADEMSRAAWAVFAVPGI